MLIRLRGTITALDGANAALTLEDEQVLKLPVRDFTPAPVVGDPFSITILPEEEAKLATDELARTLLNELIRDVPTEKTV